MKRGRDRIRRVCPGKGDRAYTVGIALLLALTFFLLQGTYCLNECIEATMSKNRETAYGAWEEAALEVSEKQEEDIEELRERFLEKSGRVTVLNAILADGQEEVTGGMDEEAWELARLEVVEGRKPERRGEIAVTASALIALGKTGVGDTVTLTLPSVFGEEEREYTICGVLPDYQLNWSICEKADFPAIFLSEEEMTEDFAENFAEKTIHLLMRAAADYSEIFQDIRASWDAQYDGAYTLVHNDEAYPDSDSTTLDGWLSLARKLVLGVSLMMQCMIYASLIEKRLPSCRYFWQLGASRSRILAMTLREGVELWLFVLPAGILAACTITALLVPVIGNFLESEVVWAFSWRNLLFSAAYGTAVSAVGLLIPSLRLPFLLDGEKPEQSSQNKDRKGRFASRRKLSSWRRRLRLSSGHFLLRRWRMYPWRTAASFVLTMLILAVSVFTVRGIYAQLQNLYFEERGYGGDYEFISYGEMVNEEGVWGIPLEKLSALAGVYGISEVRAYTITEPEIPESRRIETVETEDGETQAEVLIPDELCGGFTVDLQESANDEYFLTAWEEAKSLEIAEDAAVEKASADAYPIDIYGCRTESELKRLSESLSEGELRSETFMSGDEVILYVPPYRNGRSYKYETYFAKSGEVTNGETVRQQRIRPGDSLTLSYTNPATGRTQEKTVTVAGLIETWKDENAAQPLPDSTYTVITGGEFFDAFPDFVPGQYCQYVGICLDGTQDINSLEKILRPYLQELVSWHVNMTSSGKRLREVREETLSTISFYLFFGGYLIFLFLFLLMRLMRTDAQSRESETEILRSLGMEKRSLRRISLAASGIYAALSAALGMVLFPALCYWQRLQTVRLQLAEGNEAAMESLAWRWNMDFPLAWYGWIALILIFLSMLWGYLPSPEVKKEE